MTTLVEQYLDWLESQINVESYSDLIERMFVKEFEVKEFVSHDYNRVVDGMDLRLEFCDEKNISLDALDGLGTASFLEVLIGMSKRLSFAAGGDAPGWAWQLVDNLGLLKYADPLTDRRKTNVDHILEVCVQRTYDPNGLGGFFPLAWPKEDQRYIELWYQMANFIDELPPEN